MIALDRDNDCQTTQSNLPANFPFCTSENLERLVILAPGLYTSLLAGRNAAVASAA